MNTRIQNWERLIVGSVTKTWFELACFRQVFGKLLLSSFLLCFFCQGCFPFCTRVCMCMHVCAWLSNGFFFFCFFFFFGFPPPVLLCVSFAAQKKKHSTAKGKKPSEQHKPHTQTRTNTLCGPFFTRTCFFSLSLLFSSSSSSSSAAAAISFPAQTQIQSIHPSSHPSPSLLLSFPPLVFLTQKVLSFIGFVFF